MDNNFSIVFKTFSRMPLIALGLVRAFYDYNKAGLYDYYFHHGKSLALPLVTMRITSRCNLHCIMCGQNGIKGNRVHNDTAAEEAELVPISRYIELIDEIRNKTKLIYIWGGEPFLYPDFMELAGYIAGRISGISVNTNGTYLEKNAQRIVSDRWTNVNISIDGFKETNNLIRGEQTYENAIRGIDALNEEKKRQDSPFPLITVVTTVSRLNYLSIDQLAEALAVKKLAWHIINLGTYTNESIGERHSEYMEHQLHLHPQCWTGFTSGLNEGIDTKLFAEVLKRMHALPMDHPIITVPVIDPEKISVYYSELEKPVREKCVAPWFSVDINYNGDVGFCADYHDYSIGNIKDQSLMEIYNDKAAVDFRNALRTSRQGIFPGCTRCYQLMLCGSRIRGF